MAVNSEVKSMRSSLQARVDEWVGSDIPNRGTEDYTRWMLKLQDVEDVASVEDVIEYCDADGVDFADFVISGEFDLVRAGMTLTDIPEAVVSELGEPVDLPDEAAQAGAAVFMYGGKCFVLPSLETEALSVFGNVADALRSLGFGTPSTRGRQRRRSR